MAKKIKLGYRQDDTMPVKTKKTLYYPTMYVNNTELPLEPDDVGKKFMALVEVKVTGVNQRTNEKGSNLDYNFEVMEISFVEKK